MEGLQELPHFPQAISWQAWAWAEGGASSGTRLGPQGHVVQQPGSWEAVSVAAPRGDTVGSPQWLCKTGARARMCPATCALLSWASPVCGTGSQEDRRKLVMKGKMLSSLF